MRDTLKRLEALESDAQAQSGPLHIGVCLVPMGEDWIPELAGRWLSQLGVGVQPDGIKVIGRDAAESGEAFRARAAAHFATGPYFVV